MADLPILDDVLILQRKLLLELKVMFPKTSDWMVRSILRRRDGHIFKASSPQFETPIAIRMFSGESASSRPRMMFDALSFYHSKAAGEPLLTVPRPFGISASLNSIMIEWIDAPTMNRCLRKILLSKGGRHRNINAAGNWLQWFHSQSEVSQENFDVDKLRRQFNRLIRHNQSIAPGFMAREAELKQHIKVWRELTADRAGFAVDHAVVHNDFTPSNLFVSANRIAGFDLMNLKRRPVTLDICRFLTYLGIYRTVPVPAEDLRQYGCDRRDLESFTSAYGTGLGSIPREALLYLQYTEILRRWLSLAKQNGVDSGLWRQVQILHLKRMAKQISLGLARG